jgi:hypothetical protein
MVSSALWTDFNGDNDPDLIVVGEWLPVSIYENENGTLVNRTKDYGLDNSCGWWNSIQAGNFNGDGTIDYVLGNFGLNHSYNVSESEPLKLIYKDFDNNGVIDPFMIMKYTDGYHPIPSRNEFLNVFPQKSGEYETYVSYAKTTAEEVLEELGMDGAPTLEAIRLESCFLLGGIDNLPILDPLPVKAQFSPLFGLTGSDFNGDRKTDLLCAGNFYSNNVNDGPYSASTGGILSFATKNKVDFTRGNENGFYVPADARALARLVMKDGRQLFLVACNDDSLRVFSKTDHDQDPIKLKDLDAYALIEWEDGLLQKKEFYYGSGYLSQSSRYLSLNSGWKNIKIVTYSGKERVISGDEISYVE